MYTEADLDRDELVAKWEPLVHSIIVNHFPYIRQDTGTSAHAKIRRSVDYDDAAQVGIIGLMEAIAGYDKDHPSESLFYTFARRVIYRRIMNYIEDNMSPLKTPRLSSTRGRQLKNLRNATNYRLFSELDRLFARNGEMREVSFQPIPPSGGVNTSRIYAFEDAEFAASCLAKIEAALSADDYDILISHYAGATLAKIGEAMGGQTKSKIFTRLKQIKIKCLTVLYPERRMLKE